MRALPLLTTLLVFAPFAGCVVFEGEIPAPSEFTTPIDVAVHPDGRYVYVLNTNFSSLFRVEDGGSVMVLDADTLTVVAAQTVRIGSFGASLEFGGPDPALPNKLAVTVRADRSLVVLDLDETGGDLSCRGGRNGLACRVEGLSTDPFGLAWMGLALPGAAQPEPPAPEGSDPEGSDPDGSDPDGSDPEGSSAEEDGPSDQRWAVASLDGRVSYVTLPSGRFSDATIVSRGVLSGASVLRTVPSTGELLVAGRFSDRVASLSWFLDLEGRLSTPVIRSAIQLPSSFNGAEVRDVLISDDSTTAWLATNGPSGIVMLEVFTDNAGQARMRYRARWDLDGAPAGMALVHEPSGPVLYVALSTRNEVVALDARTGSVLSRLAVPGTPYGVAADTVRHQRLYVTLFEDEAMAVIDIDPTSPSFRQQLTRIP